jgi:hypothetical protein
MSATLLHPGAQGGAAGRGRERHGPHGPYLLELEGTAQRISVTVYDSSTALPVFFSPDPTRLGGHGMEIVVALCDRLTAERVPVSKRIRAEFELSS